MMDWQTTPGLTPYETAINMMRQRVELLQQDQAEELVWLVEHPPLYTAGSSAKTNDLIEARFPVHQTGRGGQYTYHGPGQRIAYVMLDLQKRAEAEGKKPDLRAFVQSLEQWLIDTLAVFGVTGEIREGRVGVWVKVGATEKKIAALGIRVQRWVTWHGIALNVHPDLSHYSGIVPCGIREFGVTSLHDLGVKVSMEEVDRVLREQFTRHFLIDL
ncbi:MAG: lipoate-protein ligase B [Rickettsiales bacterium]|nr:lipoate-protein ligase B [Rickettsiales bacterium]